MAGIQYINEILQKHYEEASGGIVDKPPSKLLRGEGTEKDFFILKIDLVGSTQILKRSRKETYLRLAHTFLSSIDKITQNFGADPDQTEYAGDSVLAYFPKSSTTAEAVITAACYTRAAVLDMQRLDATFNKYKFACKIVLHFDTLLVSKIGPRAYSFTTAIGYPLHRVSKIEKEISADIGRVTEEFFGQIAKGYSRFFEPVYTETQVKLLSAPSSPPTTYSGLLGLGAYRQPPPSATILGLINSPPPPTTPQQQYRTDRTLIGYNLRWPHLFNALKLNPA